MQYNQHNMDAIRRFSTERPSVLLLTTCLLFACGLPAFAAPLSKPGLPSTITIHRPPPVPPSHGLGLVCRAEGFALNEAGQDRAFTFELRAPLAGGGSDEDATAEGWLRLDGTLHPLGKVRWRGGRESDPSPLRLITADLLAPAAPPAFGPDMTMDRAKAVGRSDGAVGRLKARIVLKIDGPGGRRTSWALDGRLALGSDRWRLAGRARIRFKGVDRSPPPLPGDGPSR